MTLKLLRLITIIFILTGYKAFSEEFIIPLRYNTSGELLSNGTHYIHSFSVGDTVFTQYKIKVYQSYEYFNAMLRNGYKPYREGTNLFIDVSQGFDLRDVFSTRDTILVSFSGFLLTRYSFFTII